MEREQLNVRLSKPVIKQVRLNAVKADSSIEGWMEAHLRKTMGLKEVKPTAPKLLVEARAALASIPKGEI